METNSKKKTLSSSTPKTNSFIWRDISQSDLSEMWLEVNSDMKESKTLAIRIKEVKTHKKRAESQAPIPIVEFKHKKSEHPSSPIETREVQKKDTRHTVDDADHK